MQNLLPISIVFCLMSFGAKFSGAKSGVTFQIGRIPPDWSSYKDTLLVVVPEPKHVYTYPEGKCRYTFICGIQSGQSYYGLVDRLDTKKYYLFNTRPDHQRITDLVIALDHARQGQSN